MSFPVMASTFPSLGITLDKGSNDNVICGGNCLRCWNYDEKKCYMCKQGYFLNMERKCVDANNYYLRIPRENTDNRNIELSIFNGVISDKVTVTFWLKIFGFSSATNTIIESFSSTNTKVSLFYQEDQDKDNYGLNLGMLMTSLETSKISKNISVSGCIFHLHIITNLL